MAARDDDSRSRERRATTTSGPHQKSSGSAPPPAEDQEAGGRGPMFDGLNTWPPRHTIHVFREERHPRPWRRRSTKPRVPPPVAVRRTGNTQDERDRRCP